jgi:hypothetical protein
MEDRKLIIHVNKDVDDFTAIHNVEAVIGEGLISARDTAYCYVTSFKDGTKVIASKQPYGHKFHVGRWDR